MATFTIFQNRAVHTVLVDDCDLPWVSRYEWKVSTHGYAYRQDADRGFVRLHREVLRVTDRKVFVDHADGNRLNNQRSNLRAATPQQNAANNAPKSCYSGSVRPSRYKGVSFRRGRWRMNIKLPDGTKVDRLFRDEVEAAREYDRLALLHYGEFARPNFLAGLAGEGVQEDADKDGVLDVLDDHVEDREQSTVVPVEGHAGQQVVEPCVGPDGCVGGISDDSASEPESDPPLPARIDRHPGLADPDVGPGEGSVPLDPD